MPHGQRRSVALLGGGGLGDAVSEGRAAHLRLPCQNIVIRRGMPLRMMEPAWPKRAMQFVDISTGDLNMTRYVELLVQAGYPSAIAR